MSRIYAVIDPASPRHALWLQCLGCDFAAVESAEPEPVHYQDRPDGLAYFHDLAALTEVQLAAITGAMAEKWGVPAAEVLATIREVGLPIQAEGVVICSDPADGRAAWARRETGGGA